MKIIAAIPARYGSTRFPGKPLADIAGKSMIRRVVEQAGLVREFDRIVVATDDERIAEHVREFGGTAVLTSPEHPSGTDRCLEAVELICRDADAVVNIQGDEPFVAPDQLMMLVQMLRNPSTEIATLCVSITNHEMLHDPNKVKVVKRADGRALYFSRQAIPFQKGLPREQWPGQHMYYKHLGLYAFRTSVLRKICLLRPSALEKAESLEQLRWMENGFDIHVGVTNIETPAIDTPEDLEKALLWLKNR